MLGTIVDSGLLVALDNASRIGQVGMSPTDVLGHCNASKAVSSHVPSLLDIPKEIIAHVVSVLPYASLPCFRTTCKLAMELVDAASNGWVMKVDEGEALQTSSLLRRLTSLSYMWFESWTWEGEQEANFLTVILTNLSVFGRLQEVRFPGTPHIPIRCVRGLLAALTSVTCLSLPPLPDAVSPDSPQHRSTFAAVAALSTLTDLSLEGWVLTDAAARTLGAGLPRIRRLILGNTGELSRAGFQALAGLTSLQGLTAIGANGDNATLEPLTALTALTGVRMELGAGFADADAGPLAHLPVLRSFGWWHAETQPASCLRPGSLAPWLREVSLCCDLDMRALAVMAGCSGLAMMQVQSITLPTLEQAGPQRAAVAAVAAVVSSSTPCSCSTPPSTSFALPIMPSLRTLILGELALPPPDEPQPVARLSALFPALENVLVFHVRGRGLQHLDKAARLKRLVLNSVHLRDELRATTTEAVARGLEFLPTLPSLTGLQIESCSQLTDSVAGALRSAPSLEQLMLFSTPAVTDAFLADAAGLLRRVRSLVLYQLANVHDEGMQRLEAMSHSLEVLELRCMPGVTPAGLQVVHRLPRVRTVVVCQCPGVDKAACKELAAALAAAGRDVIVEHETTVLVPVSLADDFGEPLEEVLGLDASQADWHLYPR